MIEIVYKEEKAEANGNEGYFRIPQNVRQIGDGRGNRKIYVEDYVYTFFRKMCDSEKEGHVLILLGQYHFASGNSYFFIRSAFDVRGMEPAPDHLTFNDAAWQEVHDTMEHYFPEQRILGWGLSLPGYEEDVNELITKTHVNHFGGTDKLFLRIRPQEKEEIFYGYDANELRKLGGFYIYYEKNEPMQNYLIDENQNRSIENTETVADRAVSDFRKIVEEKQDHATRDFRKPIVYGLTAVAAAALVFTVVKKYGPDLPFTVKEQKEGTAAVSAPVYDESTTASRYTTSGESTDESDTEKKQNLQEDTDGQETESREKMGDSATSSTDEKDNITEEEQKTGEISEENAEGESGEQQEDPAVENTTGNAGNSRWPGGETTETGAEVWQEYTVQKGDTLSKISKQYYGTLSRVKEICEINHIESEDVIYAGQKILLPK